MRQWQEVFLAERIHEVERDEVVIEGSIDRVEVEVV